jgi:hypothetical protein
MTNQTGVGDWSAFIKAMPPQHQIDLDMPTPLAAWESARKAGWGDEQLTADAQSAFRRGGGVGLIVSRLRKMGETKPTKQEDRAGEPRMGCPRGCGKPHFSHEACECVHCGERSARMVVDGIGAAHGGCYSGRGTPAPAHWREEERDNAGSTHAIQR